MKVYVNQFHGDMTAQVLPLAAGLVAASAKAHPVVGPVAEIAVRTERQDPDAVVADFDAPDVLAFSCYTWNTRYSLEVARRAKQRFPGCLTVFGGPSVPRRPQGVRQFLAAHPAADVLVFGEGELTFAELLAAFHAGDDLARVPGLALRKASHPDGHVTTAARPRIADFSATASPYLDGTFDDLMTALPLPIASAVCETNRGCPFACTFCDWGQAVGSHVHELPMERVRAELDWIVSRGIPYIYLVDANFGIRRRDVDVLRHLAALKARTGLPQFCYFHLTKNATERNLDTARTLVDAGIGCQVALSMQDFDPAVLAAVRRSNILPKSALRLRERCHELSIPTFNELLLGLPAQSRASFCDSLVQAVTPYPDDSFFLYLCRLLENAEMSSPAQRERFGLESRACVVGAFDSAGAEAWVTEQEDVVIATAAMPRADWRRAFRFGYLLAAVHNLHLLDVVLRVVRWTLGADLRRWVDSLLQQMDAAPTGTVLAALGALLRTYARAVQDQGTQLLPAEGTGAHRWPVGDALLLAALRERAGFFREVREATHAFLATELPVREAKAAAPLVDEAFRYQELLTPGPNRRAPVAATFVYDWPSFERRGGPDTSPLRLDAPITLSHRPPPYAATDDWRAFLLGHLAALHGKTPSSVVVHDACDGAPPGSR